MGAFAGAVVLVLSRSADDGEAIKRMPWRVIVMVCGVTVLISLLEKVAGHRSAGLAGREVLASANTVTAVVAFFTGIISVYSSTSGVVLPAFLPMVPGLAAAAPGHQSDRHRDVDEHRRPPRRRVAALDDRRAVPGRRAAEESRALFNKLLAWGLSMAVVGAVLCYVLF